MTQPRTLTQMLTPVGHTGGMGMQPISGVINGVDVTNVTFSGSNITVTVTAGNIRYDGIQMAVPAGSYTISTPFNLATEDVWIRPHIVPTRLTPAVTTLPTTGTNGQKVLLVEEVSLPGGEFAYHQLVGMYEYNGLAWEDLKMKDVPNNYAGFNCHPLTELVPTITATNFSYREELYIYPKDVLSPGAPNMLGTGYLRAGGGIRLATLHFGAGVMTIKSRKKQETV